MTTFLFTAVSGTRRETSITFSANHFVAVVFAGQDFESGFNDTTAETQDQVQSGFFLDVVVGQGAVVFQLFAGKDETLLIRGDTWIVVFVRRGV